MHGERAFAGETMEPGLDNNSFNKGLGRKLRSERAVFQPWKKRTRTAAVVFIAMAVLATAIVSQGWLGIQK